VLNNKILTELLTKVLKVSGIPQEFIDYVFTKRKKAVEKMIKGELGDKDIFLEFTRATPVVITWGPAGLSGSVKMLGFIPKEEKLKPILTTLREATKKKEKGKPINTMNLILKEIYNEEVIDFNRLGGLEMGFNHSWTNIRSNGKATLLFYTPPITSYEVRCEVRIHEKGELFEYLNILHDLFHIVDRSRSNYPAYEFIIKEIYDQSATEEGFGKLVYKSIY